MKKLILLTLFIFSSSALAGGSISGYINVSITILPNNNSCSEQVCGMNEDLLKQDMGNKITLNTSNYIVNKKDDLITVSY